MTREARLLEAAEQLGKRIVDDMRRALKRPRGVIPGAYCGHGYRSIEGLGFVITCGFVTGLGAELVEAVDWNKAGVNEGEGRA